MHWTMIYAFFDAQRVEIAFKKKRKINSKKMVLVFEISR